MGLIGIQAMRWWPYLFRIPITPTHIDPVPMIVILVLMATMARQMGITLSQFKKIVAGKVSREEYYRLLKEQGRIE